MLKEVRSLRWKQLSHDTDLPRKRKRIKGKRVDIEEIPENDAYFNDYPSKIDFLPKAEHTYIKGRIWTMGS